VTANAVRLDEATRAAVAALAYRVRERDVADEPVDAELFAVEFMNAMRGHGWRPTEAVRPSDAWKTAVTAEGTGPNAEFRAAREHDARRRQGITCEVYCPCSACAPPLTNPTCTCTAPCGDQCVIRPIGGR
jgi:hypothetical protein